MGYKGLIYTDNTMQLDIGSTVDVLNSKCKHIRFEQGNEVLHLPDYQVKNPETYENLSLSIKRKSKSYDYIFICTAIPYANAYFFDYPENVIIISFEGWNRFTNLPIANGLAFFIAAILCDENKIGETHSKDVGCVNDFWLVKSGVNAGMRSAFLCNKCRSLYSRKSKIIEDIENILDLVSQASRYDKDILDSSSAKHGEFDVFLCHNSQDKPAIRKINKKFQQKGIVTWLDEEQLLHGIPWQPELEKQIQKIRLACVFVGANGIGPWQGAEVRAFLNEFANRNSPVIPVILPDAKAIPELPLFLREMNWIDLRENPTIKFKILVNAIKRIN